MASSVQMSEIHTNLDLASGSKQADDLLQTVVQRVGKNLAKKYGVHIEFEKFFSNTELYDHLVGDRRKHILASRNPHRTGIRPDGGILLVVIEKNGKQVRMPIVISENKKQGDGKTYVNKKTGKDYQASGNVVERLSKNVVFCQTWLHDESIMPFIAFCYGEDFRSESSIIDRVATIAHYFPGNTTHVLKDECGLGGMTWYYQVSNFTEKKQKTAILEVAEKSLLYYQSKYMVLEGGYSDTVKNG